MTCDWLNGQFDAKAFDLSFRIGTLTCRALLFEPHDARADDLGDGADARELAGAEQITLLSSAVTSHTLTFNACMIILSSSPVAMVADRYVTE